MLLPALKGELAGADDAIRSRLLVVLRGFAAWLVKLCRGLDCRPAGCHAQLLVLPLLCKEPEQRLRKAEVSGCQVS